jgi:hypothetical protein
MQLILWILILLGKNSFLVGSLLFSFP